MLSEKELITLCLRKIESKIGWGNASSWRSSDFDKLSKFIFEKTGENLSITTLKRVWGKLEYEFNPSGYTLDVMAKFLDYKDWRDFTFQQREVKQQISSSAKIEDKHAFFTSSSKLALKILSGLIIGGVIIGKLILHTTDKTPKRNKSNNLPNEFAFKIKNKAGNIPFSAYVSYTFSGTEFVSAKSHSTSSTFQLSHTDSIFSFLYYIPGIKNVRFFKDNVTLDSSMIIATTDGWMGLSTPPKSKTPIYFDSSKIYKDHALVVPSSDLATRGIDTLDFFKYKFFYVDTFNFISDDFAFYTQFKIRSLPYPCQDIEAGLIFENGYIGIPMFKKGCESMKNIYLGKKTISGKNNELMEKLTFSNEDFQELFILFKNEKFNLRINKKEVISDEKIQSLGHFYGIKYNFNGTGSVEKMYFIHHQNDTILNMN